MSEKPSNEPESENVRAIRQLVRLMKKYDVTAMDIGEGANKIRLRRGHGVAPAPPVNWPEAGWMAQPPNWNQPTIETRVPSSQPAAPAAPAAPTAPAGIVIESPMVGTFYASSSPDSPPFVSVGTQIRADSTVCVIEAMKVFTDIPAGVTGTITEVLVKNGQPVEYGQPMFRVNPS